MTLIGFASHLQMVKLSTLEALHRQVKALIVYHDSRRNQPDGSGENASLDALAEVLRDPRFQYADVTPTPIPDTPQVNEAPNRPSLSSAAQIILAIAGIVVVIVVFVYFARNLQVQQAAIETDPGC